jgi:hypothetical protein
MRDGRIETDVSPAAVAAAAASSPA